MVVAVVGLIGVPPLAGFAGKWLVLAEVLRAADWLAVVGAVVFVGNVVLSLGYYLPLVATLFAQPETPPTRMRLSGWMAVPLVVLAGLVLAMGVHPDPWLRLTAGVGPYLLSLTR
jgi:NADH-quinone oxidoreductase subunit N